MSKLLNLSEFASGILEEKANAGYQEVLENLMDRNTEPHIKRKLTLELDFTTDDERDITIVDVKSKVKLAPRKSVVTKILMEKDSNGKVVAREYNNQIKGQTFIEVDEETGEILTPVNENKENESVNLKGITLIK